MDQIKACRSCKQNLPLASFSRNKYAPDGRVRTCKSCQRVARGTKTPRHAMAYRDEFGKTCPGCEAHKPWDEYNRHSRAHDGRQAQCRTCQRATGRSGQGRRRELARQRWGEPVDMSELRRCPRCEHTKPRSEFGRTGRHGYCDPCRIMYARDHHRKQRDRYREEKYGLAAEQFAELLHRQGGVCAICSTTTVNTGRALSGDGRDLHIDHDHAHGVVRGLLCNRCNVTLGLMDDDPDRLIKAAEYLKNPPALS